MHIPGEGFDKFQTKITEKMKPVDGVNFDINTVLALLAAIVPLIQNCFNATPNTLRQRPFNQARLAIAIRRQMGVTFREAFDKAAMCIDCAVTSTDAECQAFIEDCRGNVEMQQDDPAT